MKTANFKTDMTESAGSRGPLKDLRVLDLADHTGSFCSRLLADLGAQVIKVERPGGDPARWVGNPDKPCDEASKTNSAFLYHNTNKLGITLNLEHSEGRRLFLQLVPSRHVIVDAFPSNHLESLGLGYERLAKENPGLIQASISGFGRKGPKRDYKSCDLVASAYGGHMAVTGKPDGTPLRLYGNQTYYAACLFGACAVLLALQRKNRTGEGEHLNISLQEAACSTLEHVMMQYFYKNIIPSRKGDGHWNNLFDMLPCKDGHIQMTVFENWETLLELMVQDDAASDLTEAQLQDASYRQAHKDYIFKVLGRWTRRFTRKELFELGQSMRFAWGSVQRPDEILSCPQLWDRGFFHQQKGEGGPGLSVGLPFKFSGFKSGRGRPAPHVGEHNGLVYHEEFGLDRQQIEQFVSLGII